MNKEKTFVYFMLFITIVVIPMALFYLMLTCIQYQALEKR